MDSSTKIEVKDRDDSVDQLSQLDVVREELRNKESQLSELVKSGFEIVEENKKYKSQVEQYKNQLLETQMDLETHKNREIQLLDEIKCIKNTNMQLVNELTMVEEKLNVTTERIASYETLMESMSREIMEREEISPKNGMEIDKEKDVYVQSPTNSNGKFGDRNHKSSNSHKTLIDTYYETLSSTQHDLKKFEKENQELKEKEKILSEYVQNLIIEKVAMEKQLFPSNELSNAGENSFNNSNGSYLCSNNGVVGNGSNTGAASNANGVPHLHNRHSSSIGFIFRDQSNNLLAELKELGTSSMGGGNSGHRESISERSQCSIQEVIEDVDMKEERDNDEELRETEFETMETEVAAGRLNDNDNGNAMNEKEVKFLPSLTDQGSYKPKRKNQQQCNDAYEEYLHLTCAALKIQYPNVDVSSETLLQMVRVKRLPFWRVYEYLSRYLTQRIQWEESEKEKLAHLKESVIAAQKELDNLKLNPMARVLQYFWGASTPETEDPPANNTIPAYCTKSGGMSLHFNTASFHRIKQ